MKDLSNNYLVFLFELLRRPVLNPVQQFISEGPKKVGILLLFCCVFFNIGLAYSMGTDGSYSKVSHETEQESRELSIVIMAPDPAWSVTINEIYIVNAELWVISILNRSSAMAAQVITTISDKVSVKAPKLSVKHYVLGKTWTWQNEKDYVFMESKDGIQDQLAAAEKIYQKPNAPNDD